MIGRMSSDHFHEHYDVIYLCKGDADVSFEVETEYLQGGSNMTGTICV
jgi:hypothetical protein